MSMMISPSVALARLASFARSLALGLQGQDVACSLDELAEQALETYRCTYGRLEHAGDVRSMLLRFYRPTSDWLRDAPAVPLIDAHGWPTETCELLAGSVVPVEDERVAA